MRRRNFSAELLAGLAPLPDAAEYATPSLYFVATIFRSPSEKRKLFCHPNRNVKSAYVTFDVDASVLSDRRSSAVFSQATLNPVCRTCVPSPATLVCPLPSAFLPFGQRSVSAQGGRRRAALWCSCSCPRRSRHAVVRASPAAVRERAGLICPRSSRHGPQRPRPAARRSSIALTDGLSILSAQPPSIPHAQSNV